MSKLTLTERRILEYTAQLHRRLEETMPPADGGFEGRLLDDAGNVLETRLVRWSSTTTFAPELEDETNVRLVLYHEGRDWFEHGPLNLQPGDPLRLELVGRAEFIAGMEVRK